ncbi:transposase [Duganella sp. CY15W]|nr:transposase [Duganella sp. CY15W]
MKNICGFFYNLYFPFQNLIDVMDYASMTELIAGLAQYFAFYNADRPHQSLDYQTPRLVYSAGVGGGELIVDRFGEEDETPQEKSSPVQRRAAEEAEMGTA